MPYLNLKIENREIVAMLPDWRDAVRRATELAEPTLPRLKELRSMVRRKRDAVAFAFIRDRWHAAA